MKEKVQKQSLELLTKKIRRLMTENRKSMVFEVGRLLSLIKEEELYKEVHVSFKEYVRNSLGISLRMAQYYARLYAVYSKFKPQNRDWLFENLHLSHLFYLTRLMTNGGYDEKAFMEFARKHKDLSARDLSKEIRKALGEPVKVKESLSQKLKKANEIIEKKNQEIRDLEVQIERLKSGKRVKFLEEMVEHYKETVGKLQRKITGLEGANTRLKKELRRAKEVIAQLQTQIDQYRSLLRQIQQTAQKVA